MERRDFLKLVGASALATGCRTEPMVQSDRTAELQVVNPAGLDRFDDRVILRITPIQLEIAKGRTLRTIGYDGSSPGAVLRMRAGVPTAFDVVNDTDHDEIVHLHGQHLAADVDGTPEEGSPLVTSKGSTRYLFKPGPSGTRWYHTHVMIHGDRSKGLYTGQQGVVLVEPRHDPGAYDREIVLVTHDWEKFLEATEGHKALEGPIFSVNGKALGHGEPVRVREGERVLFRLVNGNAEEEISLALPAHRFRVVALDGNPVPRPQVLDVLRLGSGERVDAIVEMNAPGVWVFGETRNDRRARGLGIVVEYANREGPAEWRIPIERAWDYTVFSSERPVPEPDQRIEMVFDKGDVDGKEVWRINGQPFWEQDKYPLRQGGRYRLTCRDKSDRLHPLHLHRHSFELTNVDGRPMSGVVKDTVCVEPNGRVDVDFVADQTGLSLFHCHMQNHMDAGFMSLFECR